MASTFAELCAISWGGSLLLHGASLDLVMCENKTIMVWGRVRSFFIFFFCMYAGNSVNGVITCRFAARYWNTAPQALLGGSICGYECTLSMDVLLDYFHAKFCRTAFAGPWGWTKQFWDITSLPRQAVTCSCQEPDTGLTACVMYA